MSMFTDGEPTAAEWETLREGLQSRPEPAQRQETTVQIFRVVYRRKFNLGNYQNEDIEAEAMVADGEDPALVFAALKRFVHACGPKLDRYGFVLHDDAEDPR